MDEERHSRVFENEVENRSLDEETHIARNEPEVLGLLFDRGDEDYAIEEERHLESSTLAELLESVAPEMTESLTLKRKAKPHTPGELPKEVKMLLKSMGKLKPISNPPTTRPHTRGWERQRTNNDPNIQNIDGQKKTSFSSWKTCCCCEMTVSTT
ncbi:hypothetical protein AQUCO_04700017v1 [Aquilegia coerulea]|uniref:Uncharacterized protein n=1 Tax=Aquilegia coerulea TaxID=218851 RepID=A0A2G5CKM8_AQUCA|nr:hypothetical protein AQUCO_04700017v1 [Aquilegia coerulea]